MTMLSIDLFCAADDQHRVKLLAEVLGEVQQALQSGQAVTLRAGPVTQPSDPCLVACTARALRKPWIQALFRTGHTVIAVRLDDTPLPGPCTRIVDIQTWPARSADADVEALALWLQKHSDGGSADSPHPAGAAATAPAAGPLHRAVPGGAPRVRPARARSDLRRGLILLGLVAAGLSLLWLSAQRQSPSRAEHAEQSSATTAVSGEPGNGSETGSTAAGVAVEAKPTPTDAALEPPPGTMPAADPAPATAGYADAVEHLCRAQTPAAARAWAALLDWKQQRRAVREPCVRELLEQPGFEALEAWLDLS